MNVFLWILQGVLASLFFMAGSLKLTRPKAELSEKMGDWMDAYSDATIKGIGLLEVLGALGLLLPLALDMLPVLTPLAAVGLAMTMVGAMTLHIKRAEREKVTMNAVLLLLLLVVVVGRSVLLPAA